MRRGARPAGSPQEPWKTQLTMPDTTHATPPAAEPRAAEILDAIKSVFAAKGFDGASMQDLARAVGMSAGNFYRYFPSKDAIIHAMIQRDHEELERDFAAVMQADDPRAVLLAMIRAHLELSEVEGPLWAEIEAAAGRREDVADIVDRFHQTIMHHLTQVFVRISGANDAAAADRFAAHAALVIVLVKAAAVTTCGVGFRHALVERGALQGLVLRHIERLVDDIAAGRAAPLEE